MPPFYSDDAVTIWHGNALDLPLEDASVDLICTSPPYWSLRSYRDQGEHYDGQIGSEETPGEFIDALAAATREMARVLKPSGSIFVNLGDKYGPDKSLMLLPERYRIRCVDDLGLIARAVVIWEKSNGLPESVRDRVRRSHEDWVHLTKEPRYFTGIDEIREPHDPNSQAHVARYTGREYGKTNEARVDLGASNFVGNPLGKLPGSVWRIPTQPLRVPPELGIDHFACVDTDTEILTRVGWKRHDEIAQDDEVAGLDLDSGVTRWTRVHGVHRYDYDGELVTAEARGLSMRLTPNHRTLVHRFAGVHRTRQPLEVIRADEVTATHGIPRAVTWAEDGREKSIGTDFAALLGWMAAEGWYSRNQAVYLSQSITKNPQKVEEIHALLDRLGGAYRKDRQREWRGEAWMDASWRLNPELGAEVRRIMPDKLLPIAMADLPLDEARALLDAFIDGDGHRRADGRISVFQKLRHNLDALQILAVRLGYNTTLSEGAGRWVLYLNPPRPARLRRSDGTSLVGREHYKGTVWCVTTGTGTFVARRRGTVFVTGNSYPMEWPRRIIRGWSPTGICVECGEGRRPATVADPFTARAFAAEQQDSGRSWHGGDPATRSLGIPAGERNRRITGYACACDAPTAPTRPAVILDPFMGTGTTLVVARSLGRRGVGVDLSRDYCRLAQWRVNDPKELAKAAQVKPPAKRKAKVTKLRPVPTQESLLGDEPAA